MTSFLVSVGKELSVEAMNFLKESYGEVGYLGFELFAIRTDDSVDDVKLKILEKLPKISHVLVAEVRHAAFKGNGAISFAAGILNGSV